MNLKYFLPLLGFLPIITSCDNSLETDKRYEEEKSIESYINSQKWIYTKGNGVYHVVRLQSYGYEVNYGDTILFWYKGYTVKSPVLVFDTNIKSVAIEASLDTVVRKFEPARAVVGSTPLLKGLNYGLLLCRESQKATLLFPSNLGYGDNYVGPISPWSPLAFDVEIIYLNGPGKAKEQTTLNSLNFTGYTQHLSGLYCKQIVDTGLTRPAETDKVFGSYTVKLINGAEVETYSTTTEPISISDISLPAVRIGFTLASVGGTLKIIAPSPLAYGKNGNTKVLPYTPVEITIKLDSIKTN
jgi:FKBP-type peptidyl-prolyl cis-trans isomerase